MNKINTIKKRGWESYGETEWIFFFYGSGNSMHCVVAKSLDDAFNSTYCNERMNWGLQRPHHYFFK